MTTFDQDLTVWTDEGQKPEDELCRAEALAYTPIPRINHVAQEFIPAGAGSIIPIPLEPNIQKKRVPDIRNTSIISDNLRSGLDPNLHTMGQWHLHEKVPGRE